VALVVRVREDRLGHTHSGEVVAPLSRAGRPFYFELRHRGWRYYADTAQRLLPVLIRGYPPLPPGPPAVDPDQEQLIEDENSDGLGERRLQARVRHAAGTRNGLAVERLFRVEQRLGPLGPTERKVLMAPTWHPPAVDDWRHEVPLVLLDVMFRPYTDVPCPTGNIVWLRPATADGYLRSLATAGVIQLATRP
jgi:hypothetical protein